MNVLEENDALRVLQALGYAILIVDETGRLTGAIGCIPDFENLSERTAFSGLRSHLTSVIDHGTSVDLELSVPAAPDFLQVRRQRVRIVSLGARAAICLEPASSRRDGNAAEQLREANRSGA